MVSGNLVGTPAKTSPGLNPLSKCETHFYASRVSSAKFQQNWAHNYISQKKNYENFFCCCFLKHFFENRLIEQQKIIKTSLERWDLPLQRHQTGNVPLQRYHEALRHLEKMSSYQRRLRFSRSIRLATLRFYEIVLHFIRFVLHFTAFFTLYITCFTRWVGFLNPDLHCFLASMANTIFWGRPMASLWFLQKKFFWIQRRN